MFQISFDHTPYMVMTVFKEKFVFKFWSIRANKLKLRCPNLSIKLSSPLYLKLTFQFKFWSIPEILKPFGKVLVGFKFKAEVVFKIKGAFGPYEHLCLATSITISIKTICETIDYRVILMNIELRVINQRVIAARALQRALIMASTMYAT
jgi:hypothetical protein